MRCLSLIDDSMGSVFGKQSVLEPPFQLLHQHTPTGTSTANIAYEIRRYGVRYAAETTYSDGGDQGSPFRALARYIGVFGNAQNDGGESMAMTAPVVIQNSKQGGDTVEGTKMAMTAPVVIATPKSDDNQKIMKFILPAEYDELCKIPKPTNPQVRIVELKPSVGVVHQYSGQRDDAHNRLVAKQVADTLVKDGVEGVTEENILQNFEYWGYNPPLTLPWFRRNEIWVELSEGQVKNLITK